MAEIQTYPDGTPAPADKVPYISDPAGTPALKLAEVSALGSGGGGGGDSVPATLYAYDGSTLTGSTVVTGTWTVGTEFTQTDTAATAHDLLLASAETYSPFNTTIQMDIKFPVSGYTGISTLLNSSFMVAGACIAFAENALTVISAGSAVIATHTITAAADTWHALRVVRYGSIWSIYLNGDLLRDVLWGSGNIGGNGTSLYSQSAVSHFRNVQLWVN